MSWTNANVIEFIELYGKERQLWDPKHPLNRNRGEISLTWLRIQSSLSIHCSIDKLKKKKESLMTSFRLHWTRKKKNPNYRTTWFAYQHMEAFLCGKYDCDSTNELENEFFNNVETFTQADIDPISCRNSSSPEKSNINSRQSKSHSNLSRSQSDESAIYPKDSNEDTLDEYSLYGQLLAKKLRKLDERQRDVAMHEIDNIMFRAKMRGGSQVRSYSSSECPAPPKMKSPLFIENEPNHTQFEDENISYPEHIT